MNEIPSELFVEIDELRKKIIEKMIYLQKVAHNPDAVRVTATEVKEMMR